MDNYFSLPDKGNAITAKDIKSGILRITVHAKHFFNDVQEVVTVVIKDKRYQVRYTKRIGRSDIIHMGNAAIEELNLQPRDKLKITKLGIEEFIIEQDASRLVGYVTDNITFSQLIQLKEKYWQLLEAFPFPDPPVKGTSVEMIKYFKRTVGVNNNTRIGPYTGISVFEAANRIASDLVIINGIIHLINEGMEPQDSIITVRLGTKHIKDKGDFTINDREGEAFNVASSFYHAKLWQTNRKWKGNGLSYILVNAEVFDEISESDKPINIQIVKVKDWDKK